MTPLAQNLDQLQYLNKEKEQEAEKIANEKMGTKQSYPWHLAKFKEYTKLGGQAKLEPKSQPSPKIAPKPVYKVNFGPGAKEYFQKGYASEIQASNLSDIEKESLAQELDFISNIDTDILAAYVVSVTNSQIAVQDDPPKTQMKNVINFPAPEDIQKIYDEYKSLVNMNFSNFSVYANSLCAKSVFPKPRLIDRTKALLFKTDASSWSQNDAAWASRAIFAIKALKEKYSSDDKPIILIDKTQCASVIGSALMSFGVQM